jgi:hypothetical protein
MTTKQDIRRWLETGLRSNCSHVIVVCDTFAWEDYPVYVSKKDNCEEICKIHQKNMQQVMEVYNLSMDINEQLNQKRVWNV